VSNLLRTAWSILAVAVVVLGIKFAVFVASLSTASLLLTPIFDNRFAESTGPGFQPALFYILLNDQVV